MAGDPVPAVTEAEATGETAAIYADIRAATGVAVVNLVWRNLAVTPGALPWCWQRVRPLYVSGRAAAEGAALAAALPLPTLPEAPPQALSALGLGDADRAAIGTLLRSYFRTNAMNFLTLSALAADLAGQSGAERAPAPPASVTAEGALPKLPTFDEMPEDVATLVGALDALGERDGRVVASMWRHLAHWPAFLAFAWALVAPLEADGRLRPAIAAGIAAGRERALGLVGTLAPPESDPRPDVRATIADTLDLFTTHPIGKMLTICSLLRKATAA